jgi:hypothetical protein
MAKEDEIITLLRSIDITLRRALPKKQQDIDVSTTAFSPNSPFQLYVGVEGNVKGVDWDGNAFNRHFVVGYHPFQCKSIDTTANGTTATNLAAMFYSAD